MSVLARQASLVCLELCHCGDPNLSKLHANMKLFRSETVKGAMDDAAITFWMIHVAQVSFYSFFLLS
jgi:hypothetical protein